MIDSLLLDKLKASFIDAGIPSFGFLSAARLRETTAGLDAPTRARCGLEEGGGAVVAALPYGEGPAEPPEWARRFPGPLARIARFARANWYAELSSRLARAAALFRAESEAAGVDPGPARLWRRFANSSLPEKGLALEAGLGRIGRHSLLMLPEHGSAVVIGLLLVPFDLVDSTPSPERSLSPDCENCGACLAACPTGALRGDGTLERELCLQHWSSREGELPAAVEAAWGEILYGCELCQEACPRFSPDPSASSELGRLGPGLPASWLESASEGEIRAALKGSALGMGWISAQALKRNARHLTRPSPPPTMKRNGGSHGNL